MADEKKSFEGSFKGATGAEGLQKNWGKLKDWLASSDKGETPMQKALAKKKSSY